jgi:hypothetical protein
VFGDTLEGHLAKWLRDHAGATGGSTASRGAATSAAVVGLSTLDVPEDSSAIIATMSSEETMARRRSMRKARLSGTIWFCFSSFRLSRIMLFLPGISAYILSANL